MKRAALALLLVATGCRDREVPDSGGRSLGVPVPTSGVAATTKGPEQDIFVFPKRAKQDPSALDVRAGPRGTYLVDGGGRALYAFSEDAPGQPACVTNCSTVWPAVVVEKIPAVKAPVLDAAKLGMAPRPDGTRQLTYAGLPLYYSESDLAPGDAWGHYAMSFGGHFALVGPDGKPLPPPGSR